MIILGIETSCDETAASVVKATDSSIEVQSNSVYSQIKEHQRFGGVVPEMAARIHSTKIMGTIDLAISDAHIQPNDIDAIAVTVGPGLATSLLVGIQTAQTLAHVWKKPLIPTNHMYGHVLSPLLNEGINPNDVKFPALAIIVSGGHTELVLMNSFTDLKIIGQTRDDAVGESFDKVAKLLNLPYPGGPEVSKQAQESTSSFDFPRPMIHSNDYDFSFSGLKTAVRNAIKNNQLTPEFTGMICKGFEEAVVDVLLFKTQRAIKEFNIKTVILGGGVAANNHLRVALTTQLKEKNISLFIPDKAFCTDNAAMIALAGYYHYTHKKDSLTQIEPRPNWKIDNR